MADIGVILAKLFHRIGDCRLPLNIGPAVAAQLVVVPNWSLMGELRQTDGPWGRLFQNAGNSLMRFKGVSIAYVFALDLDTPVAALG